MSAWVFLLEQHDLVAENHRILRVPVRAQRHACSSSAGSPSRRGISRLKSDSSHRPPQRFEIQAELRQILLQPVRVVGHAALASGNRENLAAGIRESSRPLANRRHVGELHAVERDPAPLTLATQNAHPDPPLSACAAVPGRCQFSRSRWISSSTSSTRIRPRGASVAIRVTAALRSRKFPLHWRVRRFGEFQERLLRLLVETHLAAVRQPVAVELVFEVRRDVLPPLRQAPAGRRSTGESALTDPRGTARSPPPPRRSRLVPAISWKSLFTGLSAPTGRKRLVLQRPQQHRLLVAARVRRFHRETATRHPPRATIPAGPSAPR